MIAHAIPPLYWLAERSLILRGSPLRRPVQRALAELSNHQSESARKAFNAATPKTEWLSIDQIDELLSRYATKPTRRDRRTPAEKSQARALEVERSIRRGGISRGATVLDLAAGDGRVAETLRKMGYRVTAIDLCAPATPVDVEFRLMDAAKLEYADSSIDAIYSFDAFEHFLDPPAVLREIHRVLRPGGVLYASFGPLYHSPHGAHQWFSTDLPYVHLLFRPEDLDARADAMGYRRITRNLNYWSLSSYRTMFRTFEDRFETVWHYEKLNVAHADMIERFAPHFCARVNDFDELIMRSIEILLKRY